MIKYTDWRTLSRHWRVEYPVMWDQSGETAVEGEERVKKNGGKDLLREL